MAEPPRQGHRDLPVAVPPTHQYSGTTMNARHSILWRTTRIAAGSLLALSALGASAATTVAAHGSGSIKTTTLTCGAPGVINSNHYAVGETVYLRGSKFDADAAFSWTITGLPGGASNDPGQTVASGSGATDGAGAFCFAAYVILDGDGGEYTADVSQGTSSSKNDNYLVSRTDESAGGSAGDGSTDPGTGTTDPGTGSTDPDTGTTDPGTGSTDPGTGTTDPGTGSTDQGTTTPPTQEVQGETDSATPPTSIALPATDTLSGSAGSSDAAFLIFGLAAVSGLAILLAPNRRRSADRQA